MKRFLQQLKSYLYCPFLADLRSTGGFRGFFILELFFIRITRL